MTPPRRSICQRGALLGRRQGEGATVVVVGGVPNSDWHVGDRSSRSVCYVNKSDSAIALSARALSHFSAARHPPARLEQDDLTDGEQSVRGGNESVVSSLQCRGGRRMASRY